MRLKIYQMESSERTHGKKFFGLPKEGVDPSLYKNLDLMYVDTLDANKVITAGIDAMLASLDRYTEYYQYRLHPILANHLSELCVKHLCLCS